MSVLRSHDPIRFAVLALALLAGACADDAPAMPSPAPNPGTPLVEHEFGVIPHGARPSAELVIPLPADLGPLAPVGFQRSCTCVAHEFFIEGRDGQLRPVSDDGRPDPGAVVRDGERLRLRLTVDTGQKEAADLTPTWTPAQVVLQGQGPRSTRHFVPLRFSFGIASPFELSPAAHLALNDLPRPIRYEQSVRIDRRGKSVKLGEPEIVEAGADGLLQRPSDVELKLADDGQTALLSVAVKPGDARPDGPLQCEVRIPTDLPDGYVLRIPVSGVVVGPIEVEAPRAFSFGRIDFAQPREMRLRVIDHDPSRAADFVVLGLIGSDGQDLTPQFEVGIETVQGRPRERIVALRYLGHLQDATSFRGELRLAKGADDAPLLSLPVIGFNK